MSGYVLDASSVLALAFDEPGADRVITALSDARISAVNYSEAGAKLIQKGFIAEEAVAFLEALRLDVVPFDKELAWQTARLRSKTWPKGISFADRACMALALSLGSTALTTDRAWTMLETGCRIEMIR
jgi:ribonuclease VapC